MTLQFLRLALLASSLFGLDDISCENMRNLQILGPLRLRILLRKQFAALSLDLFMPSPLSSLFELSAHIIFCSSEMHGIRVSLGLVLIGCWGLNIHHLHIERHILIPLNLFSEHLQLLVVRRSVLFLIGVLVMCGLVGLPRGLIVLRRLYLRRRRLLANLIGRL